MKKILVAFGDSHTAGSEIEEQFQPFCYEKAYPAMIAKYFGYDYLNCAQPGGSNQWILNRFKKVIPKLISKNYSIFVLCNFCESSRNFFIDDYGEVNHLCVSELEENFNPDLISFLSPKHVRKQYREYLENNPNQVLELKSLYIIKTIQNFCKKHNVPFLFHVSSEWYGGNWEGIDKNNFYGHEHFIYNQKLRLEHHSKYSYWGRCISSGLYKKFQSGKRWQYHFPEVYHKYWSNLLIEFINQKNII